MLLERGANVNAQNTDGYTPLHMMQSFGNHAAVSVIRSFGPNEQLSTLTGQTECRSSKGNCYAIPFFADDFSAAATGGLILEAIDVDTQADVKHVAKQKMRRASTKLKEGFNALQDHVQNEFARK